MQTQDPIQALIDLLSRLPGIGERTATRLAFHILAAEKAFPKALGKTIETIQDQVRMCTRCQNFTTQEHCKICLDPKRDSQVLCIVANVQDLLAIERSSGFRGKYFVLHKLLSPLEGINFDQIPLHQILKTVETENTQEIILATPLNVEGEATALYIADQLKYKSIAMTRLASGIPHGGELEYTDLVTLGRALADRKHL